MKKLVVALLGVALVAFVAVTPAHALIMDLDISDTYIEVGESFMIDVWVTDVFGLSIPGDEVLAFGFDNFNSNSLLVSLDSWTVGPLFLDDSAFLPSTDVAGSTFPGTTSDPILLASLSFSALDTGDLILGIESDTLDFNEGLVFWLGGNVDITSYIDITVNSAGAAPVPEPATLLLMLIGVGGLGLKRRLQKA